MLRKYYTIQTKQKWEIAKQIGYLEGDKDYAIEYFIESYEWLMLQMSKRINTYRGEYPIWLWTKRPDLRKTGYLERGVEGVLLEVSKRESDVLLSDFTSWHCVLNNMILPINELEETVESVEMVKKTWERIFDIELLDNNKYVKDNITDVDIIQGTTGKILMESIVKVTEFVAR